MAKKIGILGGSFDPVHYGHLILAEQIRSAAGLNEVIFVPARISPFKLDSTPAEGEHRLNMIRLAIAGMSGLSVSDIEINNDEPSYTYETLIKLSNIYKDDELYFIAGADVIPTFDKWYRALDLFKEFKILIAYRKGLKLKKSDLKKKISEYQKKYGADIELIRIPELEISSSDIRDRYEHGKSIRFLVPESVLSYMNDNRLYRDLPLLCRDYAKEREKDTRFRHTEGVVQMSLELAERYGADPYKAEIAAWFHDTYRYEGNLIHGDRAADVLERDFNVTDKDILNAIRFHTTGRPGMGLYEKILRIADNLEINRDYEGVEDLRNRISDDVNETCHMVMTHTREFVHKIGGTYVDISNQAITYLEEQMAKENSDDK